jgi:tetratricopeptide (TPR) repeat protein
VPTQNNTRKNGARPCLKIALFLALAACTLTAYGIDFDAGEVKSPYLREAVFDLYQEKYSSAIGVLQAEKRRNSLGLERTTANRLLALTYIAYRMPNEAAAVLESVSNGQLEPTVRNSLWLDIAKTRFRTGFIAGANDALAKMDKKPDIKLLREKEVFQAQLLMHQNQYNQAIRVLSNIDGFTSWAAFGRYNLGVALIKSGNKQEGLEWLDEVGSMTSTDQEMRALSDRANYVLGNIYLRDKNPQMARLRFERIRLDSPFSTKALLGLGMAFADMNQYKRSLAAWLELSERNASEQAVLEALLAIPFAYAELGGKDQSLQFYKQSLDIYRAESQKVKKIINNTKTGKTIEAIITHISKNDVESARLFDTLPDSPQIQYTLELIKTDEFQQALMNYRDLTILENKLKQWGSTIYKINNMSPTFKKVYVDKIAQQQSRVVTAAEEIKQYITKITLQALIKRKEQLDEYTKQALFAMAQTYQRSP